MGGLVSFFIITFFFTYSSCQINLFDILCDIFFFFFNIVIWKKNQDKNMNVLT